MTFHWVVSIVVFIEEQRGERRRGNMKPRQTIFLSVGRKTVVLIILLFSPLSATRWHLHVRRCSSWPLVRWTSIRERSRRLSYVRNWTGSSGSYYSGECWGIGFIVLFLLFITLTTRVTSSVISYQKWTFGLCVFRPRIKIEAINIKQRAVLVLVRENLS